MLLKAKNAVIYGAAGTIGSTAARAFAREGANVYLAGRTRSTLDAVADEIRALGVTAESTALDALDQEAVDAHITAVAQSAGSVDICFNVIQHGDVQGTPMIDMDVANYMAPVLNGARWRPS